MPQNPSGLQQANTQTAAKREKAKEQGLAEQNVTGASPPETDDEGGEKDGKGIAGRDVTKPAGGG